MKHEDPQQLARELLGREFEHLPPEQRRVIERVAAREFVGMDAEELAQKNTTRWDVLADRVAAIGGSWGFIGLFALVLLGWVVLNSGVLPLLGLGSFDAYPYIFLNLILSMLAAVQAPIIMMSQNRQAAKDRISARHDYEVNLRTQLEIRRLAKKLNQLKADIEKLK